MTKEDRQQQLAHTSFWTLSSHLCTVVRPILACTKQQPTPKGLGLAGLSFNSQAGPAAPAIEQAVSLQHCKHTGLGEDTLLLQDGHQHTHWILLDTLQFLLHSPDN